MEGGICVPTGCALHDSWVSLPASGYCAPYMPSLRFLEFPMTKGAQGLLPACLRSLIGNTADVQKGAHSLDSSADDHLVCTSEVKLQAT